MADIDHFVLLMQENRSFDHYFGTMSSVRGFSDMSPSSGQRGYEIGVGPTSSGRLLPFHMTSDIINDPDHSWAIQHEAWNKGAMDSWVSAHLEADGPQYAPDVMGYYTRSDLPTHYALADSFTVCDHYFSSAMGPTAPNRMFWMTGTNDPEGQNGGPIVGDSRNIAPGSLTWATFPEILTDGGVSWKVYNSAPPQDRSELTGMLKYFHAYSDPTSKLYQAGVAPQLAQFREDVQSGDLPAVSWLIPPMRTSEHPSYPPSPGAEGVMAVLDALTSNPAVWERSALVVSYDENGGFFDHVAPPSPPSGTPGEFITATHDHQAVNTPVGLGFRVPCLVISPYSRGGRLYSGRSDHTSQLRMIGKRFDVPVPNQTVWRSGTVGDLTGAFQGRGLPGTQPSPKSAGAAAREATVSDARAISRAEGGHAAREVIASDRIPPQESSPWRRPIG